MAIDWLDKDFKDMVYNPTKVAESANMLDAWPTLAAYPEFNIELRPLNKNCTIRYIALMYDKGSPIFRKIDNIHKQKIEAATLAGFKKKPSGTFSTIVDKMMVGLNPVVNHMIMRFLRLIRDEEFMQFRIYKEKLYTSLGKMQEVDDPDELKKIITVNKELTKVIESIKMEFIRPGDAKQLIETMYEQAEFEDLEITPEIIAERISKGLSPVDYYPYGKDYKLEKYSERDGESRGKDTKPIQGG